MICLNEPSDCILLIILGLNMSSSCPGCLVTASVEETIKIWDIQNEKPSFIEEHNPKLGRILSLSNCPDEPFVFCIGGDNQENNLKVFDIRNASSNGKYYMY